MGPGVDGMALPVEVEEVSADGVGSVVEESENLKRKIFKI